jgi:hypothetical protein
MILTLLKIIYHLYLIIIFIYHKFKDGEFLRLFINGDVEVNYLEDVILNLIQILVQG